LLSDWHSSAAQCFTPSLASACEEQLMVIDYVLGAIVTVGLLVYLVYAMIRPERF